MDGDDPLALRQAADYYRQEYDAIGARLLRLQRELRLAHRDARHQRTLAHIVQRLYAAANPEQANPAHHEALGDSLVALLVESLQIDCAAILSQTASGMLVVDHCLGLDANFQLPIGQYLPSRALSREPLSAPAELAAGLGAAGLVQWLWVASPQTGQVLLLGHRSIHNLGTEIAFDRDDHIIPKAVLEIYQGLMEQRRVTQALRTAEIDYRTLFESAQDAFAVLDGRQGRMIDANPHAQALLVCPLAELQGRPLHGWLVEPDLAHWRRLWRRALAGRPQILECRLRNALGRIFWAEIHLTRIGTERPGRLLLVGQDISERKRTEEQLRHYAFHDELTRLPNRALIYRCLEQAILRRRQEPGYRFALLFLDMDRFKIINDSLGHSLGDRLLIAIGQRLSGCLGEQDMIARLGGDEFLVLLGAIAHPEEAEASARRLGQALAIPFSIKGHEIFTSASIGIVLADERYSQPEAMLRDADIAMYQAKRGESREQRHTLFDPAMHARALAEMELERDLRLALTRQELFVLYQPIVALATGRITGFEALVRWLHPKRGLVMPATFIPLAEETLLILDIGRFVLAEACKQARLWAERVVPPPKVNVNLSARQFMRSQLAAETGHLARGLSCPSCLINLEITESAILVDKDLAMQTLEQLHDQGFELSMDDFGTGFSSLSYLLLFPFDNIKIDRSFIAPLVMEPRAATIVAAILGLAGNLDKRIVAEGIETPEQLAILRQLGCAYGQGYLFSPPVDAEAAEALLADPPWGSLESA